jgi:threonine 3-dehydrogenase
MSASQRPTYGRTDVLVQIKVASICGTDLQYEWDRWAQGRSTRRCLAVNSAEKWWRWAMRRRALKRRLRFRRNARGLWQVFAVPHRRSHICQNEALAVDADGAFAEYVVIPESNIWKLDPGIPQEYVNSRSLGNAVHTVLAGGSRARAWPSGLRPIGSLPSRWRELSGGAGFL